MRIAILGPYFWPQVYGIEKVMYSHAKHLAARGHEVHVFTSRLQFPEGIERNLPGFEAHDGFFIRRLDVLLRTPPLMHYPSKGGFLLSGLHSALNAFRPDVVHAHNIGAAAWAFGGARYANKSGAAFFYSTHHHPDDLRLGGLRKSLIRAMNYLPLRTASKIYHLTSRDFNIFPADYRYAPFDRFAVLANGVDPPTAKQTPTAHGDAVKVLFVGRVDDVRKGFAVLEAALEVLPVDVRRRLIFSVVGTISDATRQRLELKFGSSMSILGQVSEIALEQAYADADIFVMPSLYEGFGMPYIEAMRYGLPVIGSDVGGVPEVVPVGTGILTPAGDVSAVASALSSLATNPDLRMRFGVAGKEWSKRYFWNTIVDGLVADYESAIGHSKSRLAS